MMRSLRWSFVPILALLATAAAAEYHTFVIDELYSNADGTVQYIVLHESAGMDGENMLAGHQLTSTSAGGVKNVYTFTGNLPGGGMCGYYGCTPSPTANKRVLIATQGLSALGLITPNYMIPNGFLPINGGTLDYAGVDSVTFAALPTDGVTALNRDGTTGRNLATNFSGATASIVMPGPATVLVIEYYHQILDHYFMTAKASDIAALDSGAIPGWLRTGETFQAYSTQATGTVPVCRFFIPPEHGSSHFFSAKATDCAFLLMAAADPAHFPSFSGYIEEDVAAFYATLPDGTGACPAGTVPVFRLWNQRFDSNHRFTTKASIVADMKARNYVEEGDAPNFAVMCAVQ